MIYLIFMEKALVTGCRRGIGKAIAIGLAKAGADIIGVSANLEENSDVEKEIKNLNREFNGFKCDFSDRSSLYSFINQIKNNNIMPDILINNAGTILRAPADQHPDEYWDKVIEVNLNSQIYFIKRNWERDDKERFRKNYIHCFSTNISRRNYCSGICC